MEDIESATFKSGVVNLNAKSEDVGFFTRAAKGMAIV